jgi:RNA polymerase sigma factor (sigma-70 family)
MSGSGEEADWRVQLARDVEEVVEREAHFMAASPEAVTRAKESLILSMLGRFQQRDDLARVKAWHPFLCKAARRALARERRMDGQTQEFPSGGMEGEALASEGDDPERLVQERHEYVHLMAKVDLGLRELSPKERQVLELRFKGLGYEAIAGILGITRDSAYVHGSTGIGKLRRIYRAPA